MAYSDPEKQKAFQRKWQRQVRLARKEKVYAMLGGKCLHCGIEDRRVLQIDHIEPILRKGWLDRVETSGTRLMAKLARGIIPITDVQLLCANCHCIKTCEVDSLKFHK